MEFQENADQQWFNDPKFEFYWKSLSAQDSFSKCSANYLRNFKLMKMAVDSAHKETCRELEKQKDIEIPEYLRKHDEKSFGTNRIMSTDLISKPKKTVPKDNYKKSIKVKIDSNSIDDEYLKFYEEGLKFRMQNGILILLGVFYLFHFYLIYFVLKKKKPESPIKAIETKINNQMKMVEFITHFSNIIWFMYIILIKK